MKRTILNDVHRALGAKMVDFSGWDMPVQYTNVIEEHNATRNSAGLFDISHMGEFFIKGKDAKKFLNYVLTNDLNNLQENKCFYSALCNEDGGIVDDLFVYKLSDEKYMLVVNAGRIEKDFNHLKYYATDFDVELEDASDNITKLDLQGPKSKLIIDNVFNFKINIKRFEFMEAKYQNNNIIISRTGYTGEDGFEIYIYPENTVEVWKKIMEKGKECGLKAVGLGARDTLRLESSYSLYGHELNEKVTPIEAGIGFVVKPKSEEYIGKKKLLSQKEEGTDKKLVCFEMVERSVPREGYKIILDNECIGNVTSGTFSPTFKKGIGMGFVSKKLTIGDEINIEIRNKNYNAKIVKRPFYEYMGGKKNE